MLDSWNMVSKAWCVSAKEGRSEGFHLQPDRKTEIQITSETSLSNRSVDRCVLLLTGPHELVDLLGAALGSVHTIVFLQQLVDLGQVNAGVRRHAVGGDLPQQHTECWRWKKNKQRQPDLNNWNIKNMCFLIMCHTCSGHHGSNVTLTL